MENLFSVEEELNKVNISLTKRQFLESKDNCRLTTVKFDSYDLKKSDLKFFDTKGNPKLLRNLPENQPETEENLLINELLTSNFSCYRNENLKELNIRTQNINHEKLNETLENIKFQQVPSNEIVIKVKFFRKNNEILSEFLILGSQKLSELRDKFFCINDFLLLDQDDNLISQNTLECKISPSSFYIEGTFYDDTRSTFSQRYSETIMKWWLERHQLIQDLKAYSGQDDFFKEPTNSRKRKKMKEKRFQAFSTNFSYSSDEDDSEVEDSFVKRKNDNCDFDFKNFKMEETMMQMVAKNFKFNKRYLFLHREKCEHVFVFTDLRKFHKSDDQNYFNYPKLIYEGIETKRRKNCYFCEKKFADWITVDDFHAPENPCYWCNSCFDEYHLFPAGEKIYSGYEKIPYKFSENFG
ncbi:small nuclear RNA activating complex, polypeptide 3 [Lobulomyces angularis]|nr:small nuclear RNA activating complex, polypeptide 3 [Lobulomyces angularis]